MFPPVAAEHLKEGGRFPRIIDIGCRLGIVKIEIGASRPLHLILLEDSLLFQDELATLGFLRVIRVVGGLIITQRGIAIPFGVARVISG